MTKNELRRKMFPPTPPAPKPVRLLTDAERESIRAGTDALNRAFFGDGR